MDSCIQCLCICSAAGAAVSEGRQPPLHYYDDVVSISGSGSGSAMDDMVQHRHKGRLAAESEPNLFLETNTLCHQLLRISQVVKTINERAHHLQYDMLMMSVKDQFTDALVHLRSVVVAGEQPASSSSPEMQQAELHAGAGLAAMRTAVDAGMAGLEAYCRSQDDAVHRLREMWRRLQLDVDALAAMRRRGQNDHDHDDDDDDDGLLLRSFQAHAPALEESIDHLFLVHDTQSIPILEANLKELRALRADISVLEARLEDMRTLRANISAALEDHARLVTCSTSPGQIITPGHTIR